VRATVRAIWSDIIARHFKIAHLRMFFIINVWESEKTSIMEITVARNFDENIFIIKAPDHVVEAI
jgi:hypothetical protein